MNLSDRDAYFWIGITEGWTYRKYRSLRERYASASEIARQFEKDRDWISSVLSPTVYERASGLLDSKVLAERQSVLEQSRIRFITPADRAFPYGISVMSYDRPFVLYYAGNAECFLKRGLAVVGTRRKTAYGDKATRLLLEGLRGQDINIISGLADGIDTCAHESALSLGLSTVAVLGSGITKVTPSGNVSLAREIVAAGGAVVSEFEPDFAGSKYSYPQRNRLIAAMSDAVMVVEAAERSGAMYTVDHAIEQGKDVLLVPANIDSRNFGGIKRIYRSGKGNFILDSDELLEALRLRKIDQEPVKEYLQLDMISQKILDSLRDGALNYDSLFEAISEISASQLTSLLTKLEISGLVESRGGLYYKR